MTTTLKTLAAALMAGAMMTGPALAQQGALWRACMAQVAPGDLTATQKCNTPDSVTAPSAHAQGINHGAQYRDCMAQAGDETAMRKCDTFVAPTGPYLCPAAGQPTTAEMNLMLAVVRVFVGRYLPMSTMHARTEPGMRVVVGSNCADVVKQDGTRFKLYRPQQDKPATYELDTASGDMVGTISFDKLGSAWRANDMYVVYQGLPGAVCDGPAIRQMKVWQEEYRPGQCLHGYATAGDNSQPPLVEEAMQYIFANLTAPAEVPQSF